jgi:hypothetical protein
MPSRSLLLLSLSCALLLATSACKTNSAQQPSPTKEEVVEKPEPKETHAEKPDSPDISPTLAHARGGVESARVVANKASLERAEALAAPKTPFEILEAKKSERSERDLVLVAVGDVSQPTKQWREATEGLGVKAFAPTQRYLDSGDLVFMNLENPISELEPSAKKTYAFTSPPHRLGWYFDVGFNLFSLSNNHIADADQAGIDDTLRYLEGERERRGVQAWWAGAGASYDEAEGVTWVQPEGKNLKIAYFSTGFSKGANVSKFWSESLVKRIEEADKQADLVIVSVHAGKEYQHVPKEDLAKIYRGWVDAGADLVIGHHPHVIRPVEVYKQGLILHSLGNYVFASRTTRHRKSGAKMYGLVARVVIQDGRVSALELVPTWVNNSGGWSLDSGERMPNANFTPLPLEGPFADVFFEDFAAWTAETGGTQVKRNGNVGRIELPAPEKTESAQ